MNEGDRRCPCCRLVQPTAVHETGVTAQVCAECTHHYGDQEAKRLPVVVAVVQFFHPMTFNFGGGDGAGTVGQAITWPALISPHWLALLAALGAFFVAGLLAAPSGGEAPAQS